MIVPPGAMPFDEVQVLCDVKNPLYGPDGAAWIYGPQKGGAQESLAVLDAGLRHIAALAQRTLNRTGQAQTPGAGAAGGLGFGALMFLNATLRRGIEVILDITGFDAAVAQADLVITGEGHIDAQSSQGKLIEGVCSRAGRIPVIALCGKLSANPAQIKAMGLTAACSINQVGRPLAEMLAATAANLRRTAAGLPF
jgi:glycerate kinase